MSCSIMGCVVNKMNNSSKIINRILRNKICKDKSSLNYAENVDWEVKCPKCGAMFWRNQSMNTYDKLTCPTKGCNYGGKFKFIKKVED